MKCRECGLEVDNEKAFCPMCGAPMKVTADYDYIQAEIANKVDQFFNDEVEEQKDKTGDEKSETDLLDEIIDINKGADAEKSENKQPVKKKKQQRSRNEKSDAYDELAKTRNIYGNDSIFDDNDLPDDSYNSYESEYEEEKPARRAPVKTKQNPPVKKERRRPRRPEPDEDYYEPKDQTAARVITVLIIFVIIAACAVGVMAITGVFGNGGTGTSIPVSASSLTSNITPGEIYSDPVEISLSSKDSGNIFYTVDGTEPSIDSKMYTGPFTITADDVPRTYPTVNLRAVSFGSDSEKSGDLNITFQFEYDESKVQTTEAETETVRTSLEAPQIMPESGSYSSDINITVVSPDNVDIYYTYDGSTPTTSSQKYTRSVKMIPGSSVFSAICAADGIVSSVATASYELYYDYATSPDTAIWNVKNTMIWNGYISDYDGNTYEGGHADINHLGVYTIGDYTYYMVEADVFGADGIIENTYFYAVGVNYGNVYTADRDGNSFVVY